MEIKFYDPAQPSGLANALKSGCMFFPLFLKGLVNHRFTLASVNKVILVAVASVLFSNKVMADYTVASGATINANTITGQTGVLTINGRLDLTSDVSLAGFTSVIINAPNGQIYWNNSSIILTFAAGTGMVISKNALWLQTIESNGNRLKKMLVDSLGTIGVFVVMEANIFNPTDFTPSIPNTSSVQRNHNQLSQSFFVQMGTPGAASVTFNEDDKSTDYVPKLFRLATTSGIPVQSLRTSLLQTNADHTSLLVDAAMVEFDDRFTEKVDIEDALKFSNITENLSILRDKQFLTIERRPLVKSMDTIFLQLTKTTERSYRFEFVPADMDPLVFAWLEDSFTGKSTALNLNETFNVDFTITSNAKSSVANRFRIVLKQVSLSTLPVTFKAIQAIEHAGKIAVSWTVENELNIKNYKVEKSADGVNYEKVNSTVATGADRISTTYTWLDANPLKGNNFYRIRSVGVDGRFDYSNTVMVKTGKVTAAGIRIYPNPVTNGVIGTEFKNMAAGMYQVRLLNAQGQTILTKKINLTTGGSMEYINAGNQLFPGIYQLEVISPDNETTTVKMIAK